MISTLISIALSVGLPLMMEAINDYRKGKISFNAFEEKVTKELAKIKSSNQLKYDQAMDAMSRIPYQAGSSAVKTGRMKYIRNLQKQKNDASKNITKTAQVEGLVSNRLMALSNDPSQGKMDQVTKAMDLLKVENPA